MNTSDVRGHGTLLQDAVYEDKRDFIRILLDFGFVSSLKKCIGDAGSTTNIIITSLKKLFAEILVTETFPRTSLLDVLLNRIFGR